MTRYGAVAKWQSWQSFITGNSGFQYGKLWVSIRETTNDKSRGDGSLRLSLYARIRILFLVQGEVDLYGDRYRGTHHGVVADTQEAHHLYVSRH